MHVAALEKKEQRAQRGSRKDGGELRRGGRGMVFTHAARRSDPASTQPGAPRGRPEQGAPAPALSYPGDRRSYFQPLEQAAPVRGVAPQRSSLFCFTPLEEVKSPSNRSSPSRRLLRFRRVCRMLARILRVPGVCICSMRFAGQTAKASQQQAGALTWPFSLLAHFHYRDPASVWLVRECEFLVNPFRPPAFPPWQSLPVHHGAPPVGQLPNL